MDKNLIWYKDKRIEMYHKAQEIYQRDVPWMTLFHTKQLAAFRSNVMGYKLHPVGAKIFKGIYYKNDGKQN